MSKQFVLNLDKGSHGGRRENSGRKRIRSQGVAHRKREKISARTPLHITIKYKCKIRSQETLECLKKSVFNAQKKGLRIIEYSLQSNHIHLIVEADSNLILEKGMRSLTMSFVKQIQKLKGFEGGPQLERYHLHVLKTPKETRNAVNYVLFNEFHHNKRSYHVDNYSSLIFHHKRIERMRENGLKIQVVEAGRLFLDKSKSWLLTSSSKGTASAVWQKPLYP